MHSEVSFSIADIECYILRARSYDLTNKASTARTCSESSFGSDLQRNMSVEDLKDQQILLSEGKSIVEALDFSDGFVLSVASYEVISTLKLKLFLGRGSTFLLIYVSLLLMEIVS